MQLEAGYLWFKALHVAFMVTWFAGLFYLPRLFIYHTDAATDESRETFIVMQRRLFVIMTIGAALTLAFGAILLLINTALLDQRWFQAKLVLLVGLAVFHVRCRQWMTRLAAGRIPQDTRWLRWFNEIPVVFLVGIICLAIARPI